MVLTIDLSAVILPFITTLSGYLSDHAGVSHCGEGLAAQYSFGPHLLKPTRKFV
ncbi:hypothetical protein ABH892_004911 [Paenibacillus sp. RC254]